MSAFPCTACGLCCRQVAEVERAGLVSGLDRGDGVCRNLDERTNLCRVYETRPDVCRVDAMFDRRIAAARRARTQPAFPTRVSYYNANIAVCRRLQAAAGVPESERIAHVR